MRFGELLRSARRAAGLTQAQLAELSGIPRPNIAAYESARRRPLVTTADTLLAAVGVELLIDQQPEWSWTTGRRPYAVPSHLWRLGTAASLRRLVVGPHLWWSGPPRTFDLSERSQRLRAYEVVLREGTPGDIAEVVDGTLLCEAWPDLVLPAALRTAWQPLVDGALDPGESPTIAT